VANARNAYTSASSAYTYAMSARFIAAALAGRWLLWPLWPLTGCTSPPPTPPPASSYSIWGSGQLHWDTSGPQKLSLAINGGSIHFTAKSFSDIDVLATQTRLLAATFVVNNQSSQEFQNLTLLALALPDNVGGTAIGDIRGFPSESQPQGPLITNTVVAKSLKPIHAALVGGLGPAPDPNNSDFQGFNNADSEAIATASQKVGLAQGTALQYGYLVRNSSGGRRIGPGQSGRVTLAWRLPRNFGSEPNVYRFSWSFILLDTPNTRLSRSLEEDNSALRQRLDGLTQALGQPENQLQVVVLGASPTPSGSFQALRLDNLRIGTNTSNDNLPSCLIEGSGC
jgi:hypothetical protein